MARAGSLDRVVVRWRISLFGDVPHQAVLRLQIFWVLHNSQLLYAEYIRGLPVQ